MGADRRGSRSKRSGRYGSDGRKDDPERHKQSRDVEGDDDRQWGDDRHQECFHEHRDVPERGRKRSSSDRSDDEYDGDCPDQHTKVEPEEESNTIMLRGLPLHVREDDIRSELEQLPGPQPVDIRMMRTIGGGVRRGIAFVEFYRLQDSTRWMETNQNKLVIQGESVALQYSNKTKFEKWLCNACGAFNFRKTLTCFRCGEATEVDKEAPGQSGLNAESQEHNGDTIILRNIAPVSTVDGILNLLSRFSNLSAGDIRLIKDKQTGQNRGFAFVELSSPLEASQLLKVLQSLQPPLKLDGKTICVDYAKSARKDVPQPVRLKASPLSVARTAIAAAQWSSSQRPNDEVWQQQQQEELAPVMADGLLEETKTSIPAATGVVISQAAQLYQPVVSSQPATQPQELVRPVDAAQQTATVCTASPVTPAASTDETLSVCAAPTANTTDVAATDNSTYQHDEASGYYYSAQTGLFYDPSCRYYYNAETQQYLYWISEEQTYVPAPAEFVTGGKKGKTKARSAQKIAKEMARWAEGLNKQKESFQSSFQDTGPSEEEERNESTAAQADFFLFGKKQMGDFDPSVTTEQFKTTEQDTSATSGLFFAVNREGELIDWKKMVCLLCRRQFSTRDALLRHELLSDLHKKNMELERRCKLSEAELEELERKETKPKYRDRAAKRRERSAAPEHPAPNFYQPPTPPGYINHERPTEDSWQECEGLWRHQQDTDSASLRAAGTGLGIEESSHELSASDTYEDAVHKAWFSRSSGME